MAQWNIKVTQQPVSWTMADLSALFAGGAGSGQRVTGVHRGQSSGEGRRPLRRFGRGSR